MLTCSQTEWYRARKSIAYSCSVTRLSYLPRLNFAAGFFGIPDYQTSYYQEILIENNNFNSTLSPQAVCPNNVNDVAGNLGGWATGNWTQVYLNATVPRLQQYVTGLNLTISDVFAMQQLCAYETVSLGYSKFCELFTEEEWRGFDYAIGDCGACRRSFHDR